MAFFDETPEVMSKLRLSPQNSLFFYIFLRYELFLSFMPSKGEGLSDVEPLFPASQEQLPDAIRSFFKNCCL
jgi:hypothetical protein